MIFEIRRISHTADGREIVRSVHVEKAELRIGRAAESDIHLQDLAVEFDHARIGQTGVRGIGRLDIQGANRSS